MNTSEDTAPTCPRCGSALPADAPQGLCPACLLAEVAEPAEPTDPSLANAERWQAPDLAQVSAAFPQLEIMELLGRGGMSLVYKARQPLLERTVALKLLPHSLASDAGFRDRFTREGRVLARLNHPNIVSVFDFGEAGGFFFLLMEYVDGVNLRQAMRAARFTLAQALQIVPKICDALAYAHAEGVLHRDIKPENILLDTRGRVKIADFGIAKLVGELPSSGHLTEVGATLGTPHYMAPEQIEQPSEVDHRADIYSLGVVFYEMLTGELPLGHFPRPSEKSPLDPRVDDVVMRALAKERERRQQSAGEVKTDVETLSTPSRPQAGTEPPKSSICYLSTPAHLRTFYGRYIYLYTDKGQLMLGSDALTFSSAKVTEVIPLNEIRELGIGHYPAVAKPVRLDFLAVTWGAATQERTLLLTPHDSALSPAPDTNSRVAEWLDAVQQATERRTGRKVRTERQGALGTKPPTIWAMMVVLLISLGFPLACFFTISRGGLSYASILFLSASAAISLVILTWFARRTVREKATPPRNPWPRRIFWFLLILIGLPLLGIIIPAVQYSRLRAPQRLTVQSSTPHGAQYSRGDMSAFVMRQRDKIAYVLFAETEMDGSHRGTSNSQTLLWRDEGSVTLPGGASFGYSRTSDNEGMLTINGREYTLASGAVFLLGKDSSVRQLPLYPSKVDSESLPTLAAEIRTARPTLEAAPVAR